MAPSRPNALVYPPRSYAVDRSRSLVSLASAAEQNEDYGLGDDDSLDRVHGAYGGIMHPWLPVWCRPLLASDKACSPTAWSVVRDKGQGDG